MDPVLQLHLSVKALSRELERLSNETMRPYGLTSAQADALIVIGEAGPLSIRELGGFLIAEGGHPTRLVDRLVAAGLVDRRQAATDRRSVELSLTPAGRRLQRRLVAARAKVVELGREIIGDRDLDPTLELLEHLLEHTSYAGLLARRRAHVERG